MDRANKAYVSFVQSYAKHECNVILRVKDLDLGGLASAYGLLKMPKMPETKKLKVLNFVPEKMDLNSVAYTDKTREEARQTKLQEYQKTGVWPGFEKRKGFETKAWSQKVEVLEKRREKKQRRAEKRAKQSQDEEEDEEGDEGDDFEADYKMMKRLKKGKISQDTFDKAFDIDAVEIEGMEN